MAWFVLSTFAGLRPEEAEQTTWDMIHFDEGWIRVEEQTTKVRQRRVVTPHIMAMLWLQHAKDRGALLPITPKIRKNDRNELRAHLGWKVWKQDVTRHSAASYWLADSGDAKTVAHALGHGEDVLKRRYMALVTKLEAAKYWLFTPPTITGPAVKVQGARAKRPQQDETAA
jgi:integrase